jgi:hypothetical protein
MHEILIGDYEISTLPTNNNNFVDVQFQGSIKNHSDKTWNFLKITVHLLNSEKFPVKESMIYEKVTVYPNDNFSFKTVFNCIPIKLLGSAPDCIVHVSACEAIHLPFQDLVLPSEPHTITEIKLLTHSEVIKVLKAGIWKYEPDETRTTKIQSFFQLQVMDGIFFPQVRLEIDLYDKDGAFIDIVTERKQASANEVISLQGGDHIKERKLIQATAKVNIFFYKLIANNLTSL